MPGKTRKPIHGRSRRKAARQRFLARAQAVSQSASQPAAARAMTPSASAEKPSPVAPRLVATELRTIGILGGAFIVVLIVVALILRYTVTI